MKKLILWVVVLAGLLFMSGSRARGATRFLVKDQATTVQIHLVNASTGAGITGATVGNITAFVKKHSATSSGTKTDLTITASGGSNDAVEVGLGAYNVELTASNTDTLRDLTLCYSYAAAVTQCDSYEVIAANSSGVVVEGLTSSIDDFWEYLTSNISSTTGIGFLVKNFLDQKISLAGGKIRIATAQAGTSNTITLDVDADTRDDFYKYGLIKLIDGTGVGQWAGIESYNGTTKVATVRVLNRPDGTWHTIPSSDTVFVLEGEFRR